MILFVNYWQFRIRENGAEYSYARLMILFVNYWQDEFSRKNVMNIGCESTHENASEYTYTSLMILFVNYWAK